MESENRAYLWTTLNTIYKITCCVRKRHISLRHFLYVRKTYVWKEKLIIILGGGGGGVIYYVYLPVNQTLDNSK